MKHELNPEELNDAMGAEVESGAGEAEATPDMINLSLSGIGAVGGPRREKITGQLASLRGEATDPVTLARADIELDGDTALIIESNAVYDRMGEELAGAASAAVTEQNMDPAAVVEKVVEANERIEELRASPVAQEWAVLKEAAQQPLDSDLHREIALQFAMTNTLAKLSDEMGWGDYVADGLPMMIPFRETAAYEQMKGGIRGHTLLSKYVSGNSIEGMITSWQALPVARKEILYPVLVQSITDSLGFTIPVPFTSGIKMDSNSLLAITSLMRFFQPDGGRRASLEQKAFAALDVFDVGFSAAAAASKVIKAAKAAKAIKFNAKPTVDVPVSVDVTLEGAAERFAPDAPEVDVQALAKQEGKVARKEAKAGGASKKEARIIGKQARKDERARLIAELSTPVRKEMEAIMMNAVVRASRENTIPHLLAKAGAKSKAADINLGAMTNPEIARAYGIHSDDAIDNAMPFQTREWMPQIIEGLVPEIAKKINAALRATEQKVRSMTDETDLFRAGVLDQTERTLVANNFLKNMERIGEDMMMEGITLSDVKVLDDTAADAFTFEYTMTRTTDSVPETFTGRRSWRINEATGNFTETVKAHVDPTLSRFPGLSPAAASVTKTGTFKDFNDTVKEAHILQDIEVAAVSRINELLIDASSSISGIGQARARARVDAVELAGDAFVNPGTTEKGRVFTPRELAAGIKVKPTKNGDETIVYLTDPREVEAYYMRRLAADAFSGMQNYVTRRELEILGFKSISVRVGENSVPLIAKPFEDAIAARGSVRTKVGFEAYDGATGRVVTLNPQVIDEMYDRGMVLTRLQEDWNVTGNMQMLGGKHVEYVFTPRQGVSALPQQVTHYRQGYVPKINEGVEFVVQQLFPYKKAGQTGKTKTKALRAFASRKQAEEFIELMASKYASKRDVSFEDAKLVFDIGDGSVMGQVERMQNNMSGSGGLFTGSRAEDDLLMGLDGVEIERMSPAEAFGRYVDHLGTQVSKNEWRMAKEQQWINTARSEFPGIQIRGFDIAALPSGDPKSTALMKLHKQIQQWNRMPSQKESFYQAQVQNLHDWALNGVNKVPGLQRNAISSIMNLKHAQPTNAAMSASMHLMLGTLNMSQVFVQSITSVIALSLGKVTDIPGIIRDAGKFGFLDNIRDAGALDKVAKKLAGATDEEVRLTGQDWDMYKAWQRSGQRESVRSNADMNYMASTGLGVGSDLMRKAGNGSLYLYRMGELANRRVSFISAYKWAIRKHPKMDFKSDDFLEVVLKRSNLTMLELNSANKAWWQGGKGAHAGQKVAQMMSQFLQVGTKTVELIVKSEKRGGFSKREKLRIAAGQMIMFGSSGVPPLAWFGTEVVDLIADGLGLDRNDPDDVATMKSIANTYNQGMIGFIAREVFGADVKISSRTAIAANIVDTAWDLLTSDDPMVLKMLGVSGVVGERLVTAFDDTSANLELAKSQALVEMSKLAPYAFADRSNTEELTDGEYVAVFKSLGTTLLGIPSSTRSLMKAYIMHNTNKVLNQKGGVKIEEEFNLATEIGVAWSFQLNREASLQVVTMDRKAYEKVVSTVSDVIVREYHNLAYLHDNDPAYAGMLHKKIMVLQEGLGSEWMKQKLRKSLQSRLRDNPQTKEELELAQFFQRHMEGDLTQAVMVEQGVFDAITSGTAVVLPLSNQIKPEDEK